MTAALLAISILTVAGLPLATWLEPSLGWRARTGVSFMLGAGVSTLLMLSLSLVGISWSPAVVLGGVALVACACVPLARRARGESSTTLRATPLSLGADAATFLSLGGYAVFATLARPWEWDFWAIWGLKAKEFFLARGVSFEFLARPDNFFAHPDYPPLLSLVYDFVAILEGRWDDRWMGVLSVAFAVAMLAVMREELERQSGSPVIGAAGTLALSGVACSAWVGLGEGPLVALASSGLVIMSRGLRDDAPRAIAAGSVLLGLSALTKNEGLSFVVATAVVTVIVSRRRVLLAALPAAAVVAPWLVARVMIAATTDVFEGGFVARFTERLSSPSAFFETLAGGRFERPLFWLIALVALMLHPPAAKRQRFLIGVALLQALSYIAVYAGTLNDLASHVQSSFGRVTSHLAPLVGIVAILAIGAMLKTDHAVVVEGKVDVGHER
ncbi:MAG: hypothetical protein HYU52_15005 [Acidobacteria bacterium]|nr:hypothetical protein [Acidobacteriota bacterium]